MDIGTTTQRSGEHLPFFKITCEATQRVMFSQDPGRALISGKCEDVGAIVVQQFRGLAGRAPYFANGTAKNLEMVSGLLRQAFRNRVHNTTKARLGQFPTSVVT